jgi:phasin family protein
MKDVLMNSLQAAGFPFSYTDLTKAWVNFALPFLHIGALREAHRKNAAAWTSANQVVFDGLKTVAQRQGDLFKARVDVYSKVTSDVLAGTSVEQRVANQADTTQHIYVSTVGHMRALSDIAVKANVTAVDILNARIIEAFDELKSVFAEPVALTEVSSVAPTEVIGEHIAMVEQAAAVGDVVGQVEPEPTVKTPKRKKAAPPAKAARRHTSRR